MILDTIAKATEKRIAECKKNISFDEIKKKALGLPKGKFVFEKALKSKELSFICEIKKASPSKGLIAKEFPYLEIAKEYENAGASAISILTEPEFFMGSDTYLQEVSEQVRIPCLRKDFTIDEYQIYEAKTIGASAVLLICALLDTETIRKYIEICDSLGLSALVEAHNADEIRSALDAKARVIGVNNRDLKTFQVDVNRCLELRKMLPDDIIFVAESGIKTNEDIRKLEEANVNAVLIGETLMVSPDKRKMLNQLKG